MYLGHWFSWFLRPCSPTPQTGHGESTRLILLYRLSPTENRMGPTVTTLEKINKHTTHESEKTDARKD